MEVKNILVLLGHSDCETTCGMLANVYENAAKTGGHHVKRINICDLKFDPILHKGYKVIQTLEPDLVKIQNDFRWADHIVIFYPNWWGTMPALLKGLFDRFFLPGFAFRFNKNGFGWAKLLSGKTGRVFITMDMNPWLGRIMFGDNSNEIRSAILGFAGINTHVTKLKVKDLTPDERDRIKRRVADMGRVGE